MKRYKFILISILSAVAAACLFAGCKLNTSLEDVLKEHNLTARVTYFLNAGEFEDQAKIKEMYYTENSTPYNISTSKPQSGSAAIAERYGFDFTGWYKVVLSANGKPLYTDGSEYIESEGLDLSKSIQMSEEQFDFSKPLASGDHFYVVADWVQLARLNVHLVCDGFDKLVNGEQSYATGDIINEYVLSRDVYSPGSYVYTADGYTFLEFYEDKDFNKVFDSWPVRARDKEDGDVDIYARFISGTWTVVKDVAGVSSMFRSSSSNYYFFTDEIDCSELSPVNRFYTFTGKIEGNGCIIKNLKVKSSELTLRTGTVSMFGNIRNGAEIKNIKFENLSVTYTVASSGDPDIFFVFSSVEENAVVSNVEIGGQMNITLNENGNITNTTKTHWIFGGVEEDSEYTGIKITDGTACIINDGQHTTTYTYIND